MRPLDILHMEVGILKESRFHGGKVKGICTDCGYNGDTAKACPACETNTVVSPEKIAARGEQLQSYSEKGSANPRGQ